MLAAGALTLVTTTSLPRVPVGAIGAGALRLDIGLLNGNQGMLAQGLDRVQALKNDLDDDWKGNGAEAPTDTAVVLAASALMALSAISLVPDRIEASVEGGIALAFFRGAKYADFECFNSGEILASTSDRVAPPRVWRAQPHELAAAAADIRRFLDA